MQIAVKVALDENGEPLADEVRRIEAELVKPGNTALSISGLYTSSPVAYGKPSLHAIGSGLGSRVFGWGLYASDNRIMVERVYSKYFLEDEDLGDDIRPAILEQVWWDNRPEGDETHLLPYFDVITGGTRKLVNEAIEGVASDYALDDDAISLYFGEDWQTRDMTGQEFYDLMTQVIGERLYDGTNPEQAASQALAYYDIDGIVYPVGSDRAEIGYEGKNYVAFSDEHLRVVGIEEWNPETGRFEKRDPGNTALSLTYEELQEMPSVSADGVRPITDKAHLKETFRRFGVVTNGDDGRKALFPAASAGKFLSNTGERAEFILPLLGDLYRTSRHLFSEDEHAIENHKTHRNYLKYHHYINKVVRDGEEYYMRLTVTEQPENRNSTRNEVHSGTFSRVAVYNENGDLVTALGEEPSGERRPPFTDTKIANWLKENKPSGRANASNFVNIKG